MISSRSTIDILADLSPADRARVLRLPIPMGCLSEWQGPRSEVRWSWRAAVALTLTLALYFVCARDAQLEWDGKNTHRLSPEQARAIFMNEKETPQRRMGAGLRLRNAAKIGLDALTTQTDPQSRSWLRDLR